MVIKVTSKNQITIPKKIADMFALKSGDFLEVEIINNKIVMTPKEATLEDKYPVADLQQAEQALSEGLPQETHFATGSQLLKHLKQRAKK